MGQFSNSFPKHFNYLCEYAFRFDLSCSFCEYPFVFHCLHCSPSCFDPDSLLLAYLWLGLSWIDCISANKSFSSPKTSSRKPYTSSKQQERQKHSVETTINFSLPDGPIYVPEDSDTAMQAPEWASILSIVDGSLNPVPLCDLDQVLLKEIMAENRGLTLSDLKNRAPEHLSATLTGCESPDDYLKPAAVKEDADDQLSEIASTIPPVDPSCVDLKRSAFLAQLLLEEVDLESTPEPASPVGKPVLHMQPMHTGEPVARSADALARPAANNMPLSEHDTQELWRLLYLKAEGIERQERLQYLRQTWNASIWSEEDNDSYTLPDPEIPLVYSLHSGQQCPPEWDDGSVPAETADRQKKKEHRKSNLHAEKDFLQKLESLNLDPRLKKLLITYEKVFGALPPLLSCKKLVQMDLKLKPEFEKTRMGRRPYPAPQEQVEEIERQIQECIDAGLVEEL